MGTHEELLKQGGIYRSLYETQFRKILESVEEKDREALLNPQSADPEQKPASTGQGDRS